jgi:hypothetical protein
MKYLIVAPLLFASSFNAFADSGYEKSTKSPQNCAAKLVLGEMQKAGLKNALAVAAVVDHQDQNRDFFSRNQLEQMPPRMLEYTITGSFDFHVSDDANQTVSDGITGTAAIFESNFYQKGAYAYTLCRFETYQENFVNGYVLNLTGDLSAVRVVLDGEVQSSIW